MKNTIICTGLILILGIFGFGQKQDQKSASASTSGSANGSSSSKVTSSRGITLDSGTRIEGELQNTVDVKKSKVGDKVLLKTTKDIKQNGKTVVAKGSSLIGRITEVSQKTKSNGQSRLGMVFDRIESKNLSAPISASIMSITNAAANANVGDMADADLFGSSSTSARTSGGSSGGGSSSGGGLLGGVGNTVGSTVGGVTSTAGGVLNTTTQTAGGITNSVGQTVGNTTDSLGRTVNGIQISNAVNGSVQSGTTLSAADRNIKLDKGATIQLQLNSSARTQ
jgi:hypothetical protein